MGFIGIHFSITDLGKSEILYFCHNYLLLIRIFDRVNMRRHGYEQIDQKNRKRRNGIKLTASFKGKDHFQFENEALLVFACNMMPPISVSSEMDSIASRMIIFPFTRVVPREEWVDHIEDVLIKDADSIIEDAIQGLRDLEADSWKFNESPAMLRCKREFIGQYSSFSLFMDEYIRKDKESIVESGEIQAKYKAFCDRNGGVYGYARRTR